MKITSNFFLEIIQARGEWSEMFKMLREKNHQPRILHPKKLSFKSKGKIDLLRQTKIKGICCW